MHNRRVILENEIANNNIINGNLIKQLCSGGDTNENKLYKLNR